MRLKYVDKAFKKANLLQQELHGSLTAEAVADWKERVDVCFKEVEAGVKTADERVKFELDAALNSEERRELEEFVEETRTEAENFFSGVADIIVQAHLQAENYLRASVNVVKHQYEELHSDVETVVDAVNLLTLNIHNWAEAVVSNTFESRLGDLRAGINVRAEAEVEGGASASSLLEQDAESRTEVSLELRIALTHELESRFNKARVEAEEFFTTSREALLGCSAYHELKESFEAHAAEAEENVRA